MSVFTRLQYKISQDRLNELHAATKVQETKVKPSTESNKSTRRQNDGS